MRTAVKLLLIVLSATCLALGVNYVDDSTHITGSIKTDSSLYVGDTTTVSTEPCKFVLKDNATSRIMNSRLQYDFGKFGLSCIDIDIAKDPAYYIQGLQLWGAYDTSSYLYLGMKPEDASVSAYLYLMSVEGFNGDFTLRTGYNGTGSVFANTDLIIGAGDSIYLSDKTVAMDTFIIDSVFNVRNQPVASGPDTFFVKDNGSDRVKVYPVATLMAHGVTTNYLPKATGATTWGNSLVYDDGTNIGIGTAAPLYGIDLVANNNNAQIRLSDNVTDLTNKNSKIIHRHYDNAEEDILAMQMYSTADITSIRLGGTSANQNTATDIRLYTASDNTTVTGTERVRVDSLGILTSYYGLNLDYLDASRPVGTNADKNIAHADSSYPVPCSLFDGATYRATATAYIYTLGELFHILIPELTGTVTNGNTILLKFAGGTLPAPSGSIEPHWVAWINLAGVGYDKVDLKYEDTSSFRLRDDPGSDLATGGLTFYAASVSWTTN